MSFCASLRQMLATPLATEITLQLSWLYECDHCHCLRHQCTLCCLKKPGRWRYTWSSVPTMTSKSPSTESQVMQSRNSTFAWLFPGVPLPQFPSGPGFQTSAHPRYALSRKLKSTVQTKRTRTRKHCYRTGQWLSRSSHHSRVEDCCMLICTQ